MSASTPIPGPAPDALERGDLVFLPQAPFSLPQGDDLSFLLQQRSCPGHKHICFNPHTHELTGHQADSTQQQRLSALLADFSRTVTTWLIHTIPTYSQGLDLDRATLRTDEEATRKLRRHARNDLLHIDAFPGRPARGRRLLRVFVNIHPTEPRVWATSDSLPRLLPRYQSRVQRSSAGWFHQVGAHLLRWTSPGESHTLASDLFLLRLHDYLKGDLEFQQRGPRRLWRFPPGSAWLAMTDACTYAELRGQFALEHSFFIRPEVLCCPELAPARLIAA